MTQTRLPAPGGPGNAHGGSPQEDIFGAHISSMPVLAATVIHWGSGCHWHSLSPDAAAFRLAAASVTVALPVPVPVAAAPGKTRGPA